MLVEQVPHTRASRARRPQNLWLVILATLAVVGAIVGALLTSR